MPSRILRRTGGVCGVAASILLVAVEGAIAIAINADADTRAGWRAGVGYLESQHAGECTECNAADGRLGLPVAQEMIPANIGETEFMLPEVALRHEIALPDVGARLQQIDAWSCHGPVRFSKRHLLANNRCQVAREGEQERLDLSAQVVSFRRRGKAVFVPWE